VRINYENTIDDWTAFHRYHFENSPNARRLRVRTMWIVAVLSIAFTSARGVAEDNPVLIVTGILCAPLAVLVVPPLYRWQLDHQVRGQLAEGANKGMLGPHELELVGDVLVERSPFGEWRALLAVVERVASAGGYTFLYVTAVSAHVIPHHAVTEGDPEAFADALRRRTQ
jgi:hypothetical protein